MADGMQRGYLIIADISGYTAYLTGTALEHAHDVLSGLIQTILDECHSPLELVELEGDAVYLHLPADSPTRQTVVEAIENIYFAFCARRDAIARGNACPCEACRGVPALDLKFVVHYGEFVLQRLAGRAKPLGPDVILVHRLLKNHIAERFGLHAYLFVTDAALVRLGLDAAALGLQPHAEEYEHLGEVRGAVLDLAARWQAERDRRHVRVEPAAARVQHTVEVPAPAPVVWEYLTAAEQRPRWQPWLPGSAAADAAHAHDGSVAGETIQDWRPVSYFTTSAALDGPLHPGVLTTTELTPIADGTRVSWYVAPAAGWRAGLGLMLGRGRLLARQRADGERLKQLLTAEQPATPADAAAAPPDIAAAVDHALANP